MSAGGPRPATCLHDLVLGVDELHLRDADVHGGPRRLRLESRDRHTDTSHSRGKRQCSKVCPPGNVYTSTSDATIKSILLGTTNSLRGLLFLKKRKSQLLSPTSSTRIPRSKKG